MKDIIWSFFSTAIRTGGALIILPLILVKFSSEELGLWYFFTSVGMFVLMIDVGFSATLSRNFRYVISSSRIFKSGVNNIPENSIEITLEEILYVSKKIYFYLSIASILILFSISFYIVELINRSNLELYKNLSAWLIYAISISLNLRYYYRGAVLIGLNKIELSQKIDILSLVVNYSVTAIFVLFDYGIISLAIGTLVGLFIRILLYEKFIKLKNSEIEKDKLFNSLKLLWPNTWRTGVSNLLGYFIKYLTTFFITFFLGLEVLGSFGITFQIITLITAVSTIWINTSYPLLSTFRIEKKYEEFYNLFYSRLKKGIITFFILSFIFLFTGKFLLSLISSNTQILSFSFTLFLLIHMFIDFLTNSYGYIIMTGNRVPFIKSSAITVILIIFFNFLFNYLGFGLWGVLIGTFLAGILYNYWFWIYNGYMEASRLLKRNNN